MGYIKVEPNLQFNGYIYKVEINKKKVQFVILLGQRLNFLTILKMFQCFDAKNAFLAKKFVNMFL